MFDVLFLFYASFFVFDFSIGRNLYFLQHSDVILYKKIQFHRSALGLSIQCFLYVCTFLDLSIFYSNCKKRRLANPIEQRYLPYGELLIIENKTGLMSVLFFFQFVEYPFLIKKIKSLNWLITNCTPSKYYGFK